MSYGTCCMMSFTELDFFYNLVGHDFLNYEDNFAKIVSTGFPQGWTLKKRKNNKMKYSDGQEIFIGDRVIADKSEGIVVCVIDTDQFSDDYPKGWSYLETGVLIETKAMGLVHYPKADEDIILVKRSKI